MNAVNLPLALFTVILRRFIDKFRAPQVYASTGVVILKSTAPWVVDMSLVKSCMYAYMFFAGIYYTMKHMQRGTIVSLAKKCSEGAVTIKDRCVRRGHLNRNRSSLVRNLVRGREGQQKALRFLASMTPQETLLQPSSHVLNHNDGNPNFPYENFEEDMNRYSCNPYLEPDNYVARNQARSIGYQRLKHNSSTPPVDTILEPKPIEDENVRVNLIDSKDPSPIDLDAITLSDEIRQDLDNVPTTKPRKRKPRNLLTLRGRKILQNDLSFCGDTVVRKTRSGKVYGYQEGESRYYKAKRRTRCTEKV